MFSTVKIAILLGIRAKTWTRVRLGSIVLLGDLRVDIQLKYIRRSPDNGTN